MIEGHARRRKSVSVVFGAPCYDSPPVIVVVTTLVSCRMKDKALFARRAQLALPAETGLAGRGVRAELRGSRFRVIADRQNELMTRYCLQHARWFTIVAMLALVWLSIPSASRAQPAFPRAPTYGAPAANTPATIAPVSPPTSVYNRASVNPAILANRPSPAPRSVYIRDSKTATTTWISDAGSAPVAVGANAIGPAVPAAPRRAPSQSLWMVSTRKLAESIPGGEAVQFLPDVWRYVAATGWAASTLDELLKTGTPAAVKAVFVHGNDTSPDEAAQDGQELFRQLQLGASPALEMQCIVWSWPTAPVSARVRQTAQANAQRTNLEGYLLACFLERIGPESPVSVAGYCSGARIVTGGLHVLGGGALEGRRLTRASAPPPRAIHATLLAPALDNDWLASGGPHERACSQVSRMAITVNPDDAVLRFYPFLWGRKGAPAMGATGVADLARLGPDQSKVKQLNVAASIERSHGWKYYSGSPEIIALLRHEMLQLPVDVARLPAAAPRR